jgi:hypothetical protein
VLRAQWKFKLLIGFLSAKILRAPSHLCTEAIQLDMIQTKTGLLADRIGVNHDLMELIRPTFLTGDTYFNGQPTFEVLLRVLIQDCFEEHWKRADSPNCQPIPFDRVRESFQHWIKYHIANRSYELESSIAFMEASEEIMQFLLSSPLFPDAYSIMPVSALEGDQIWILRGSRVPFVLRLLANGNHKLIGEAYVHGFMRGELFTEEYRSHDSATVITLE